MNIKRENTVAAVIDFQEKLMPVMNDAEQLRKNVTKLLRGIGVLEIPFIVTQQYTRGLGDTIVPVKEVLGSFDPVEKISFSAMGAPEFRKKLKKTGADTIILCGIETHICVQQTVLDLTDNGYKVFLAADCTASRKERDRIYAEKRMEKAGAVLTTAEAVLFELLSDAEDTKFKEISAIIK